MIRSPLLAIAAAAVFSFSVLGAGLATSAASTVPRGAEIAVRPAPPPIPDFHPHPIPQPRPSPLPAPPPPPPDPRV